MASLGSAEGRIVIDVAEALQNVSQLENRVRGLDGMGGNALSGLNGLGPRLDGLATRAETFGRKHREAGVALGAFGALVGAAFGFAGKSAADFEQVMSGVQAVAGSEVWAQFGDDLSNLALRLGKDTSFGAIDAALAIEELVKAGISAENILGGAADAVVLLAEASGTDLVTSSEIAATAMNQFGLAGEDMGRVADILTNGANKAQSSVESLGYGMSFVGTTAKQLGIPLDDVVAGLAALEDQGIKGSRAGTSLNQALTSIVNPSAKAKTAMDELGLSIGQSNALINEDGSFKDLTSIIENVDAATRDLTESERARYINQIFGEQGGRAINALLATQTQELQEAGKGWDDYQAAIAETGTAQEQAKIRMDNFRGSWEELMGTLETIGIVIGSRLLGPMRAVVDFLASLGDRFLALPGPVQTALAAVVGITGALAAMASAAILVGPVVLRVAASMVQMASVLPRVATGIRVVAVALRALALANPILALLTLAITAFALAWQTNFLGFQDKVREVVASVTDGLKDLQGWFDKLRRARDPFPIAAIKSFGDVIDRTFGTNISQHFDRFANGLQAIGDRIGQTVGYFQALRDQGLNPVSAAFEAIGLQLSNFTSVGGTVGAVVADLSTVFDNLSDAAANVWAALGDVVDAFQDLITGDLGGFFDELHEAAASFGDALGDLGGAWAAFAEAGLTALQGVWDALSGIDWGGVLDTIIAGLGDLGGRLLTWATEAVSSIDWHALWNDVTDVTSTIVGKLGSLGSAVLTWVTNAVRGIQWGNLWGDVTDVTATIVSKLGNLSLAVVTWALEAVRAIPWADLWGEVTDVTGTIVAKLGDLAAKLLAWATDAAAGIDWAMLWDGVVDVTDTIVGNLGDLGAKLLTWVSDAVAGIDWTTAASSLGTALKVAIDGLTAVAADFAGLAANVAGAVWDAITSWLGTLSGTAAAAIRRAVTGIINGIATAASDLGSFGVSVAGAVLGAITNGIAAFIGFASAIKERLLAEMREAAGQIGPSTLSDFGSDLASKLKDAIVEGIGAAVGFAGAIKDRLLQELAEAVPSVSELASFAGNLASAIGQALLDAFPDWVNRLLDFIPGLNIPGSESAAGGSGVPTRLSTDMNGVDGVFDPRAGSGMRVPEPDFSAFFAALENAVTQVQVQTTAMTTRLQTFATQAGVWGTNAGQSFVTGLQPHLHNAATQVQVQTTAMQSRLTTFATQAQVAGTNAGTAFRTTIQTAFQQTATQVQVQTTAMQTRLSTFAAQAQVQGRNAGENFRTAVTTAMQQTATQVQVQTTAMQSRLSSFASQAGVAGRTAGTSFADGITAGMHQAVSAAQSGASRIRAAMNIGSQFGVGSSIGASLGQGIAAGISGWASRVASAAAAVVRAGINAARAEAATASPSKRMMELGELMGRGLSLGLLSTQREVNRAFAEIVPGGDARRFAGMPVTGRSAPVSLTVHQHFGLRSDEYVKVLRKAETGDQFARTFPQELQLMGVFAS